MLLPSFEYHQPGRLGEVIEMLDPYGGRARLLAGGTDLLVNMKKKTVTPDHVVALEDISELREIIDSKNRISIGSMVTAATIAQSRAMAEIFPLLSQAAGCLGSPQVRNRATIGGNLSTARPAADLPLPLLALGAQAVLESSAGKRTVSLDQFFLGPGQTVARPEEVMTAVVVDRPEPGTGGGYVKLGLRRALEISLVNVAAVITMESDGKTIKAARVALGAVAPTPVRSPRAEKALAGCRAGYDAFVRAGLEAAQDARPITDHRGSAEYRREMVAVLTRRALQQAWERAFRQ
jgi:CO/xanthine dehydrogenase FAD-binding subunit